MPASRKPCLAVLAAAAALALGGCGSPSSPAAGAPGGSVGGAVWVANEGDGTLTLVDAEGSTVDATLGPVARPHNVQAGHSQDVVWVTGTGGVIGIDAEGLYPTHVSPAGRHPAHVVEDGARGVLVTASGDGAVRHLSPELRTLHVIHIGGAPHGVRVAGDARLAVVANTAAGAVDVVDLVAGRRTSSIEVGPSPVQVAVDEEGRTAYASVAGTSEVVRVNLDTGQVTGRARVAAAPAQILLTGTGLLLSADQGTPRRPGHTVSIIDPARMAVQDTITVGSGPHGLTATPDGARAWVTNSFDGTLSVLDLATRTNVATVDVGEKPNGVTYTEVDPDPSVGPAGGTVPLQMPGRYSRAQPGDGHTHSHDGPGGHGAEGHSAGSGHDHTHHTAPADTPAAGGHLHAEAAADGPTPTTRAVVLGGFGAVNAAIITVAAVRRRGLRRAAGRPDARPRRPR